jgi:hypothetical protein
MTGEAILVGDVGGTNVRFALAYPEGGRLTLSDIWKRRGADFPTFAAALDAYLKETGARPDGAALGLAGVVIKDHIDLINRGWSIALSDLRAQIGGKRLVVVNDFVAMARAAPDLDDEGLDPIRSGVRDPDGSAAVGGPGTGFGIAILRRIQSGWVVTGGEGGHQAYAPQTPLEWAVAEAMRRRGVDVSNELVAAGAGFDVTRDSLAEVMGVIVARCRRGRCHQGGAGGRRIRGGFLPAARGDGHDGDGEPRARLQCVGRGLYRRRRCAASCAVAGRAGSAGALSQARTAYADAGAISDQPDRVGRRAPAGGGASVAG